MFPQRKAVGQGGVWSGPGGVRGRGRRMWRSGPPQDTVTSPGMTPEESSVLSGIQRILSSPSSGWSVKAPTAAAQKTELVAKTVDSIVHAHLAKLQPEEAYGSILRMSVLNEDFKLGKMGGVTWHCLRSFLAYKDSDENFPPLSGTKDEAFRWFTRQPSVAILREACRVFRLQSAPTRYDGQIQDLANTGAYKAACDAAVCLERLHFHPGLFCLPLLLMDKPATMETYISKSPDLQGEFLECLDKISSGEILLEDLLKNYPAIKATAAHKLSGKPLDKMIKRYAEKFTVPDTFYPRSKDRWAKADLDYWIRQMFSSSYCHDLQLENWREMVRKKVGQHKSLQQYLVAEVDAFNREEASALAEDFGIEGYEVLDVSEEEEDWEAEIDAGAASAKLPVSVANVQSSEPSWDQEEVEEEDHFKYLELPSSVEVCLVDSREKLLTFLSAVEVFSDQRGQQHLGLDVESFESSLSTIQISLDKKIFLLDWIALADTLGTEDVKAIKSKVFINQRLSLVGFGVVGDIKLISKTIPGWEDLPKTCKTVIDLERTKTSLCDLVGLEPSSVRGLSGLCHSVLGRRLHKAEQISDWSRRPLRQSQVTYAAMDAFSCWKVYQVFKEKAEALNLSLKFKEIVSDQAKRKERASQEAARAKCEAPRPVTASLQPLCSSSKTPAEVRLVCDDMLQGLCRRLRDYGLDCVALSNGQDHLDCVHLATRGAGRYVVSRGTAAVNIARRLPRGHTLNIKSSELDLQVEEVFQHFNIVMDSCSSLPRCLACNGGIFYHLPQRVVGSLRDNFKRRKEPQLQLHTYSPESDSDEEDWPGRESHEEEWEVAPMRRLEEVKVVSSHTGEERRGHVNVYTGHTETGLRLQLDNVMEDDSLQAVTACGKCGAVRQM